jgi:hypothetical protein
MGFFDSIKSGWNSFTNTISSGASAIANKVESGVSAVFNAGVNLTNKVVDGGFNFMKGQQQIVGKFIDKGGDVILKGEDVVGNTVSNVASSLSLPLMIGAGLLGGILLLKK